jgi:hypothetical protein
MLTKPRLLLHLEGAALLALSAFLYHQLDSRWWPFAVLFLAADLFMLGYLTNVRFGSALYNFAHTLSTPAILLAIAYFAALPPFSPSP